MPAQTAKGQGALDFSQISALVIDPDHYAQDMIGQALRGFALRSYAMAQSGHEGQLRLENEAFELVLVEAVLPDMSGADFVRWLRRHTSDRIRYLPVIMLTGHTALKNIQGARDSGANHVVKKPISCAALFDRIAWSAATDRCFVEAETYNGPDRRFKSIGPPNGVGRRSTDLSLEVGEANEPNLSQVEIDAFMKPMKVSIE